jgi:hypothetical protein
LAYSRLWVPSPARGKNKIKVAGKNWTLAKRFLIENYLNTEGHLTDRPLQNPPLPPPPREEVATLRPGASEKP